MPTVARYYLPPAPGSGPKAKPYASSWKMSPEEAKARGLTDADIVPGSTEVRTDHGLQSAGRDGTR